MPMPPTNPEAKPASDGVLASLEAALAHGFPGLGFHTPALIARIRQAEQRVKALEDGLRPFAKAAIEWSPEENGGYKFADFEQMDAETSITVGDLRRARRILKGTDHG